MLIPKVDGRITQYINYLENNAYRKIASLDFELFETKELYRTPPADAVWKKIAAPAPWGSEWNCTWFRSTFTVPPAQRSADSGRPLFISVLPNADSLVFLDGKPYGALNLFHKKLRIKADGGEHTIHVEAYAGNRHGGCGPFEEASIVVTLGKTISNFPNTFDGGSVLERLPAVYSLFYDVRTLYELTKQLDNNSLRKARILKGLYDALMGISLTATGDELEAQAEKAAKLIAPLLAKKNSDTTPQVHLIGHAHIDHAWLWPVGETTHKAARTYINMIRFMEEYPEFRFIQTQPAQLEVVKNEYPDIFASVKKAYQTGAWEPNGGMWVEADCNLPSGESLIRQFLVGKGFNEEHLGYEADTLWLPDVFGYAAALPQILKGCRIKYFVTSKLSWNDTTRFPYDTFIWRGIDGSGIKTHLIPSTYNGHVNPGEIAEIWNVVQHKEIQSAAIRSVGEGDGGGGTLRSDIEMARRMGDLEGTPKTAWKTATQALDDIFSDTEAEWPEWRGELYLELHRGTYTTQSRTKCNNRRLEFALRHAEWIAALSDRDATGVRTDATGTAAATGTVAKYPHDELLAIWKQVLLHQFHDIIPGSAIGRVYEEAEVLHKKLLDELALMTGKLRRNIRVNTGAGILVFNDLSWERKDPLPYPADTFGNAGALQARDGTVYPVQRYKNLDGIETAVCALKLPPLGWAAFSAAAGTGNQAEPFKYTPGSLETPFYRVRFDKAGRIISLFDKLRQREQVAEGGSFNALISAEDVPVFWDAWDIDSDWVKSAKEETALLSSEIAASGPVCFRLRQTYRIGSSTLIQDVVFYAEERRIDFDTRVTWQERHRLLKVGFDTAIDTTQVRCEVQYGHIVRNTHRNLPQDRAKFEICAHKWICVEEPEGGIALLNDSKYGHDVLGGRMRLSLLRSPIAPDPEADQGEHRFVYAILPFAGSFNTAGVVRAGYELNDDAELDASVKAGTPTGAASSGAADYSLCSVDGDSVIIESVKAPEVRKGSAPKGLVLRLYESLGGSTRTVLRFNQEPAAVQTTDMLEGNAQTIPVTGKDITLEFKPFEIKTLLVSFAK